MSGRFYVDTNVLITTFETDGAASDCGWAVLDACAAGAFAAVTSELTLAEVLPRPLADGDRDLADGYETVLARESWLTVVPVSRAVLLAAARLRASDKGLKLADAIHVATAAGEACKAFLTDDRRIRPLAGMAAVRLGSDVLSELRRAMR